MNRKVLSVTALLIALAVPHAIKAYTNEFPRMQEGLWSIHMVTKSNPGNKVMDGNETLCRNHAYDAYAHSQVGKQAGCTLLKEGDVAGTWTMEGNCKVGTSIIHTQSTIRLIDNTHVHTETHSTYTPPAFGTSETSMVMDQTYKGACLAGTGPGDMTMGNGMVRHLWKH